MECLEVQLAELEALHAAVEAEGGGLRFSEAEDANISLATAGLDAAVRPSHLDPLSATIALPNLSLRFTLPVDYPASPPLLQLGSVLSRSAYAEVQAALDSVPASCPGECCMLLVLERMVAAQAHASMQPASPPIANPEGPQGPLLLRRVLLWFHHIASLQKRKHIVAWARELALGGYSKPGWPGVVVVEGSADDVEEYVRRLRGLQWQAMQVRADECHEVPPPLDAARRFADGFQELDADSMGQLSRACRECGLEALFATALKL